MFILILRSQLPLTVDLCTDRVKMMGKMTGFRAQIKSWQQKSNIGSPFSFHSCTLPGNRVQVPLGNVFGHIAKKY